MPQSLTPKYINTVVTQALQEDAAGHDITTTALVPATHISRAHIVIQEEGVICGLHLAKKAFQKLDPKLIFQSSFKEGALVPKNTIIGKIKGKTQAILTGERTALNFLGHLSGIATLTQQYVKEIRPHKAILLDTRKTIPTVRGLEKYAVHCGGGVNHRMDLAQMALIKDNHRAAVAPGLSIEESVQLIRKRSRQPIEVEADNLTQFRQALNAGADIILLDNMNIDQIKQAVKTVKKMKGRRPLLEASGGVTLLNIKRIAQTGVDRISTGALTHSAKAIDISLEILA